MTKGIVFVALLMLVLEVLVQRAEYKDRKEKEKKQIERERIREEIRMWREQYNRPHPKYERR